MSATARCCGVSRAPVTTRATIPSGPPADGPAPGQQSDDAATASKPVVLIPLRRRRAAAGSTAGRAGNAVAGSQAVHQEVKQPVGLRALLGLQATVKMPIRLAAMSSAVISARRSPAARPASRMVVMTASSSARVWARAIHPTRSSPAACGSCRAWSSASRRTGPSSGASPRPAGAARAARGRRPSAARPGRGRPRRPAPRGSGSAGRGWRSRPGLARDGAHRRLLVGRREGAGGRREQRVAVAGRPRAAPGCRRRSKRITLHLCYG